MHLKMTFHLASWRGWVLSPVSLAPRLSLPRKTVGIRRRHSPWIVLGNLHNHHSDGICSRFPASKWWPGFKPGGVAPSKTDSSPSTSSVSWNSVQDYTREHSSLRVPSPHFSSSQLKLGYHFNTLLLLHITHRSGGQKWDYEKVFMIELKLPTYLVAFS